jgi:hypothetical protein
LVRSVSRLLVLMGVLVALAAVPAQAQTLDQHQDSAGTCAALSAQQSDAQFFTAGFSGDLTRVELFLRRNAAEVVAPLTVEIRDVGGIGPGTTIFASATVPAADVPLTGAFVAVDFAAPAAVAAGTQYAIVVYTAAPQLATGGPPYLFCGAGGDLYPAGAAWANNSSPPDASLWFSLPDDFDFAFRTYVLTPYELPTEVQALALSGSTVRFRLAAPATVRFSLDKRVRRGRYLRIGKFTTRASRGRNRVRIPRRLNGRRVGKGLFRLSARAVNSGGRGALTRRVVRLR